MVYCYYSSHFLKALNNHSVLQDFWKKFTQMSSDQVFQRHFSVEIICLNDSLKFIKMETVFQEQNKQFSNT